jgi:predicted dinucleotide-binding enzyme
MATKKTIAIIGAASNLGSTIAKELANGPYRLLLFAEDKKALGSLSKQITIANPSADIDCMGCAADASWEADIIISTVSLNEEKETARKIEPFANRKILVSISSKNKIDEPGIPGAIRATKKLQKLLPGAKAVKLFNASLPVDSEQVPVFIAGDDDEALQTVREILQIAGYEDVQLINLKTKHNEKTI